MRRWVSADGRTARDTGAARNIRVRWGWLPPAAIESGRLAHQQQPSRPPMPSRKLFDSLVRFLLWAKVSINRVSGCILPTARQHNHCNSSQSFEGRVASPRRGGIENENANQRSLHTTGLLARDNFRVGRDPGAIWEITLLKRTRY